VQWVDFDAPTSNRATGEGLKLVSVRTSPNSTGASGEEFLSAIALSLIKEYSESLVDWPHSIRANGWEGVEAHYERTVHFGTQAVTVTGWEAVLLVENRQWTIEVVGRSEYGDELQGIHSEFLSNLQFLPIQ